MVASLGQGSASGNRSALRCLREIRKNAKYTAEFIKDHYGLRLYKPQRLLSIPLEEEERRALHGWWSFDEALRIACVSPVSQLEDLVADPQGFRDNVENLVIFMSDQVPMWLKISPGKQLYAESEVQIVSMNFAAPSTCQPLRNELVNDDEFEGDNDGMTQLRGESSGDQDKFRITVDLEQRVYGWCSETSDPQFEWGTTSVVFTGTHVRLSKNFRGR